MRKLEKNEKLLLAGQWTSHIGNIIFDYANSVTIVSAYAKTAIVLAVYQSSETLISIFFNLIGGVMADGNSKKRIVIITDLLSALVCFVLSFFVESAFVAAVIVLANILLAVIYAFNSPTYKSIIREMIQKDRIGFYNSIANGGSEVIKIAGPAVGLAMVNLVGVRGALLIDAATFLISAVCEAGLVALEQGEMKKNEKSHILSDMAEGFRYLFREKKILALVILAALVNFFLAGYNLLIPYTDVMFQGVFTGFYSKVLIMEAAGGLAGSLISSKMGAKSEENTTAMILFLGGTGVSLLLVPLAGLSGNIICCLIPFLLFGTALTIFNIRFMSFVQVQVHQNYLGRVFSIIFTVAVLFMPVGSFVFSGLSKTDSLSSFLPVGIGIILLALAGLLVLSPKRFQK
ncbi:MAG: MFS transporter [Acetatifactor sp.]